jgi:hypothetical protein
VAECPSGGSAEQFVIGHAAPEEVGQPRRQPEIVEAGGARLDAEKKVGRGQDGTQRHAEALLVALAVLPGRFHEAQQACQLVVRDGATIGTIGEGPQDLIRLLQFLRLRIGGRQVGRGEDEPLAEVAHRVRDRPVGKQHRVVRRRV